MTRPLAILVLSCIGDRRTARKTLVDYVTAFERHAPDHHYVYQDLDSRVTEALRRIRFDVILLDSTFLDARAIRPLEIFHAVRERYDFVRTSDAVKIALPQDEYDNGLVLDDWLADWKVDVVFACGVHQHWDVVFPRMSHAGEIRKGLTGFFDVAEALRRRREARPLAERPLHLGYRVQRLPPEFGRFGQLKSRLADVFAGRLAGGSLAHDISTERSKMFMGDSWWEFLGRCKHTLAGESGSSMWDPRGEIRARVRRWVGGHPEASFAEVEAACFAGLDGRYVFRMISPRVFESASTMTSQILIRGHYLGLLQPWDHYVPVEEDFSNVADAIEASRDLDAAARRAEACFETFVHSPAVHYASFVSDVLSVARARVAERGLAGMDLDELQALRRAHETPSLSDYAMRKGLDLLKRLRPLQRFVPVRLQTRLLALLGRNIGIREGS
jgi:hypothetical protein